MIFMQWPSALNNLDIKAEARPHFMMFLNLKFSKVFVVSNQRNRWRSCLIFGKSRVEILTCLKYFFRGHYPGKFRYFFFMAWQPVAGLGHLYEIPWSHPDTPLSVRFFWTCVRHVSETATYTTRNTHKWQTSCLRRDSNPKFQQASDRKPFP
jgi:hypothetical protein